MRNELELMRQFEVEELEERLEFVKWMASTSCSSGPTGVTNTVTIGCSFGN